MPIEIRELIIKVTLHDGPAAPTSSPPLAAVPSSAALRQMQQDMTQDCVRQVLAELQRQRER